MIFTECSVQFYNAEDVNFQKIHTTVLSLKDKLALKILKHHKCLFLRELLFLQPTPQLQYSSKKSYPLISNEDWTEIFYSYAIGQVGPVTLQWSRS